MMRASLVAQMVENLPAVWDKPGFDSWVGKISWRRVRQPTPGFLPGESRGQRSLVGTVQGVTKSWTRLSDQAQHKNDETVTMMTVMTITSGSVTSAGGLQGQREGETSKQTYMPRSRRDGQRPFLSIQGASVEEDGFQLTSVTC